MSNRADLVPCPCKKCNGILRKRRTQQDHRAAEKRQAATTGGSTSKFSEWFRVHGKNFKHENSARVSEAGSDDESTDHDSDGNSGDSVSDSERPAKRLKTLVGNACPIYL